MILLKSKVEIQMMRRAGEVVALAHQKIKETIAPGICTYELDRIVEEIIRSNGAIPSFKGYKSHIKGAIDFPASICASINEQVVHGIPDKKPLKDGDIVSIDIGAFKSDFHGDAARTYSVGQISQTAQNLISATKQSFYEGMKFAVEGYRINDISCAIQDYVEKHGYSVVREYVGHGIGREMHEPPQIPNYRCKVRGPRLREGMALAIEPMVNVGKCDVKLLKNNWTVVTSDGSLSAHYENTIIISGNEPIILTKL